MKTLARTAGGRQRKRGVKANPQLRQVSYRVRMTEDERTAFEAAVRATGLHAGHLIRLMILGWTKGQFKMEV